MAIQNSFLEGTKNIIVSNMVDNNIVLEEKTAGDRVIYRIVSYSKVIEDKSVKVYGIEVTSTLFGTNDREFICDISSDYDFVKELFRIIVDNLVLPISLKEIVEDYINAKYS